MPPAPAMKPTFTSGRANVAVSAAMMMSQARAVSMPQSSQERLLYLLKSRGPQATAAIAERLGMTTVAARKHLAKLLDDGLVAFEDERLTVGRPKRTWSLSDAGHARFPDTHSDLTLELLRDGER